MRVARLHSFATVACLLGVLALVAAPETAAKEPALTVFAAASLRSVLDQAAADFEERTGVETDVSYAGSSTLARQIMLGAPADVFFSASAGWMDHLAGRDLLHFGTRRDLLSNRLVLIAPRGAKGEFALDDPSALLRVLGDGYLAMANTEGVPAGLYGKAALQSLKLWTSLHNRIAQADNVRAALALVSRGEAALGIVYRSDALAAGESVRVMATFPESSHPPIVYPAAALARSDHPQAQRFLAFLAAPERKSLFERWGFTALEH